MIPWCYGIPERVDVPWRPVLARRLLYREHTAPPGPKTAIAEHHLGLEPSLYWSVATTNGIYIGPVGGLWETTLELDSANIGGLTPFDTGGLYHGHITTDPETLPAEMADYVAENSSTLREWPENFRAYIANGFAGSCSSYIRGDRPTRVVTTRSHLVDGNTSPSWLMEARLPRTEDAESQVTITSLYWTSRDARLFEQYLATAANLTTKDAVALAGVVRRIAIVVSSPVRAMKDEIANRLVP